VPQLQPAAAPSGNMQAHNQCGKRKGISIYDGSLAAYTRRTPKKPIIRRFSA
jgi:hypothetical protein